MTTPTGARNPALTTKEAAEQLGVQPQTLEKWRATKTTLLPHVKLGRCVRYLQSDLDAFLTASRKAV